MGGKTAPIPGYDKIWQLIILFFFPKKVKFSTKYKYINAKKNLDGTKYKQTT